MQRATVPLFSHCTVELKICFLSFFCYKGNLKKKTIDKLNSNWVSLFGLVFNFAFRRGKAMQYEKIKSYILNDLMKEFVFITSPYFQLKSPGSIFGKI